MARTKVTGRGRGRGGFRLVIGGVAQFTHLSETVPEGETSRGGT